MIYEWEEAEFGDDMVCLTFEIDYDYSPGDPGNTYGPPERCWPPEPAEAEVTNVELVRVCSEAHEREPMKAEAEYWVKRFYNEIAYSDELYELMCEDGEEELQAAEDAYWEDRYEEERELW